MTTTMTRPPDLNGSALRTVHGDPLLGIALREIPDYTQALDRLAHLEEIRLPDAAPVDVSEALGDRLEAGQPVDGAWLVDLAAKALTAAQARGAAAEALDAARRRLVGELDFAARGNVNALFRYLHAELVTVLDAARTLGPVPRDMEAAVSAGKVEQLQQHRALGQRYAAIRKSQQTLHRALDAQRVQLPDVAFIRQPHVVDREYLHRKLGLPVDFSEPTQYGQRPPAAPPWPPLASADALLWLVEHAEARPHVPTRRQLADAEAEVDAAVRELLASQPGASGPDRVIAINTPVEEWM